MNSAALLKKVEEYVLELFQQHDTSKLVYHSYRHTAEVVQSIATIANDMHLPDEDCLVLAIAGWFHDVGYLFIYKGHEDKSIELAKAFLQDVAFPPAQLQRVIGCIEATRLGTPPTNVLEQIIADADMAFGTTTQYFERSPLLRLEWEYCLDKHYEPLEWEELQEQFLSQLRFYTPYAQMQFSPIVAQNFLKQKEIVRKIRKKQEKAGILPPPTSGDQQASTVEHTYRQIEPLHPERGVQTFLKASYRNQINLSAIADGKANILISVNSIVITLIFAAVFSLEGRSLENLKASEYGIPLICFVLTAMLSLVMAVLSVMPRVTNFNQKYDPEKDTAIIKQNLLFFGNFAQLPSERFEALMREVLNDSELLYGNMVRDTYYLGEVLNRKYRWLSVAYKIFLTGFSISVFSFIVVWVINLF